MTEEETNRIIADMVRERRELRLALVCMEEKLRKAGQGFRSAAEAVRSSDSVTLSHRIYFPENETYPDIEVFRALIRDYASAKTRIQEISKRLDTC